MKNNTSSPSKQHDDFETLYQRYSREVWALAYARWLNADLALDIAQEAFLRLWKRWEDGESILNPRAWLLRVARNLAEDHAKSAFQRHGTQPPATLNNLRWPEPAQLDSLEQREDAIANKRLLQSLDQRFRRQKNGHELRRALWGILQGHAVTDLARELDLSWPTTRDRLKHAIETYLAVLAEHALLESSLHYVAKKLGCHARDVLRYWARVQTLDRTAAKFGLTREEIEDTWDGILNCIVGMLKG